MPSQRTNPLTPDELATLRQQDLPLAAKLPLDIIPSTGLWPPEYLHLHRDWITFTNDDGPDQVIIRIPEEEQCRRQKQRPGNLSPLDGITGRDKPCAACRSRSKSSKFVRDRPEEMNTVVVVDDNAADTIEWWFSEVGTIPWHRRQTALKRVCREHIGREITLLSLRHTFAAKAAAMGIEQPLILDQLGVQSPSERLEKIIHRYDKGQSRDYTTFNEYLTFLESHGPTTADEIADHFDVAPGTARRRLNDFEAVDLIDITRKAKSGNDGHPALWNNAATPPTTVQCPEENCSEEFYTLHELKRHTDKTISPSNR